VGSQLVSLFNKVPECLSRFKIFHADPIFPSDKNRNSVVVAKFVSCICGNENLHLEAAQLKELKGVCSKSEVIRFGPPVYLVCPACSGIALLFDPEIHGWCAELGLWHGAEKHLTMVKCAGQPGRILVHYTYENIAAYEDLLRKGVVNIEDYSDTFSIFQENSARDNLSKIFSVKCT